MRCRGHCSPGSTALGESRQLAQIASVVGREFALRRAREAGGAPERRRGARSEQLVDAGLVRLLKTSTENKFEFRHALIREAAYNSLLRRDAVELHSALARLYEADYPEMRNARPELLAQHLTMSGRRLEAASLWLQGGDPGEGDGLQHRGPDTARPLPGVPGIGG